jgi:hypothetical protein
MRAGREHARTTGKPGWKACWTDSNRDSNVAEKGPVGGEPVGTARAVNGLSWTVGQARPGPTSVPVGVEIEMISKLVGHRGISVTEIVYRHQIRPVIQTGATVMDELFGQAGDGR